MSILRMFIYLFFWKAESRERKRKIIFHPLIHPYHGHDSQSWAKWNPRGCQFPTWRTGAQLLESSFTLSHPHWQQVGAKVDMTPLGYQSQAAVQPTMPHYWPLKLMSGFFSIPSLFSMTDPLQATLLVTSWWLAPAHLLILPDPITLPCNRSAFVTEFRSASSAELLWLLQLFPFIGRKSHVLFLLAPNFNSESKCIYLVHLLFSPRRKTGILDFSSFKLGFLVLHMGPTCAKCFSEYLPEETAAGEGTTRDTQMTWAALVILLRWEQGFSGQVYAFSASLCCAFKLLYSQASLTPSLAVNR